MADPRKLRTITVGCPCGREYDVSVISETLVPRPEEMPLGCPGCGGKKWVSLRGTSTGTPNACVPNEEETMEKKGSGKGPASSIKESLQRLWKSPSAKDAAPGLFFGKDITMLDYPFVVFDITEKLKVALRRDSIVSVLGVDGGNGKYALCKVEYLVGDEVDYADVMNSFSECLERINAPDAKKI